MVAEVVRLNPAGEVQLPDMSKRQKKSLLGGEIGTAFDMYTRMFASFGGGDVFEIGEWRARDMDLMLRRDGVGRQVEQALTLPVRQTTFSLEGQKGDTGQLDLVEQQLYTPAESDGFQPGMRLIVGQMSGASIYRKAFFEKHWVMDDDGMVRLDDLAWRPPSTCEMKRDEYTAKADGFRQKAWWFYSDPKKAKQKFGKDWTGYLEIPKNRSYVYIHGAHREPLTGISDMDVAYWCYKQKQKLLFLWFQFLENQSLPKLAVYGSDPTQGEENAEAISQMKSSAVAGFQRPPQGAKLFDVIESSGAGAAQFQSAISFLDGYQTGSILAGFLNLPSAAALGRGSYALSESQSNFFMQSREGVIEEMCESFTRDVVAPICAYNNVPMSAVPKLKAEPLTDASSAQIIATLTQLAVAPAMRIPDQFVDMLAEKAAKIFDLPADKVTQMIQDGAAIRAKKALADSPEGATPEGQAAARIAGASDATFTILAQQQGPQPPGLNVAPDANTESLQGDLNRG
jgi:hypothetical protein